MNLVFESDGAFRFLDYQISHKQLLIRGKNIDGEQNIDLIFEGTDMVNCPTDFIGVKIYQLDKEEIKNRKIDNRYGFSKVFLLITDNKEYYIKTMIMRIYKNSLTLDESSIDMTGNGQENLIWISTN